MSDRVTRSRSFETVAAEYERHRPEYPEEALDWAATRLGLEAGARVLDVGAGTGKLTRGLVALGFEVVAVEPGAPMLAQLREAVPEAEALEGRPSPFRFRTPASLPASPVRRSTGSIPSARCPSCTA